MSPNLLELKLRECSLHELLILASKALTRSGFGDVQILDRRHSRQKSRHGGHELLCQTSLGTVPVTVVVKVIKDSIRVRMLDELAGTVQRMKADLGLIISPFGASPKAKSKLPTYTSSRIEVMDGAGFSQLLSRYHIGTCNDGEMVDWQFFESLEDASERVLHFITTTRL